ncbi:uncharacterized protein [Miscanthus floridulus]|uniref:uncharacterized protein isoform X2 n=1 Tax=Miscanthus floridulus TaxID=154761 RepID=UPI00345851B5
MAISGFTDGNTMVAGIVCDWFRRIYRHPVLDMYPLLRHHRCRCPLPARTAPQELPGLATGQEQGSRDGRGDGQQEYKTPELKDRMRYPRGQNDLYDVMPVRSSFRQRRQVKNLGQKQSTELAQFYLQLKKRLPSSSQPETHADSAGSKRGGGEILISLLGM